MTTSSNRGQRRLPRALDIRFELLPELLDSAHDRSGAGIAQDADRLAGHVVGEVEQQLEVLLLTLPRQDPLQNANRPGGTLPALGALRTGFVRVEAGEPPDL